MEDKAAIFESKPSKKESSVKSRSAELKHFTNETAKRDCANDKRYVKTYAIYKETETQQNNIRGGKQNGYEISGMNIDDSEVFEDSHSGDEEMDESSDENPFDVSEILREADKAERRKTMAKAAAEKKAILQNDCKSRNVNDNDKMDIPSITRTDSSSEDIVNEDELSDFAKLVAQKQKLLKSPIQQENLHKLDKNIDGKKNLRPSNEEVLVNNEGTRGEKTSGDDMKNNRNYKGVAEMEKKRTDRPINRDMQKETTSVSESIKRAREQENRESSVVSERKTPSKELQKTPNKVKSLLYNGLIYEGFH